MAVSNVTIANLALSHIGHGAPVASLTEHTKAARQCDLNLEPAREATLAAHRWGFATKYLALADLGSPPERWAYRYSYPTDCVTARELVRGSPLEAPIPFELAVTDDRTARCLLTDREEAVLCYTARITEPALFPPAFVTALSWCLAEMICLPMTGDLKLKQAMYSGYQAALSRAAALDANEAAAARDNTPPDWLAARG